MRETGLGARRLEEKVGLRRWQLRGLLDVSRPQSPRLDNAQEIARALGLDLSIGPASGPRPAARGDSSEGRELSPAALGDAELLREVAGGIAAAVEALDRASRTLAGAEGVHRLEDAVGSAEAPPAERRVDSAPASYSAPPHVDLGGPESGPDPAGAEIVVPYTSTVLAAAGTGEPVFEEAADGRVSLPRAGVPLWAKPDRLICIRASGDSMKPGILDGDLVALDRAATDPVEGGVFVVDTEAGLALKRLKRLAEGWELSPDNPAFRARPVGVGDRLIGRVAWSGPKGLVRTVPDA